MSLKDTKNYNAFEVEHSYGFLEPTIIRISPYILKLEHTKCGSFLDAVWIYSDSISVEMHCSVIWHSPFGFLLSLGLRYVSTDMHTIVTWHIATTILKSIHYMDVVYPTAWAVSRSK